MDFETHVWCESFYREIDTTLTLCDQRLVQQPLDIATQFYRASALAYKSFQIAREGKYLKGLQLALQAIKRLDAIVEQDSSFYDAYLGIGSYLYWRSYLTRHFSWLPFFHDSRDTGIALIQKSFELGTISRWAALSNLAWIYIQEERYEDAIHCAQTGLEAFPNSRFFLWPAGDAYFLHGDFDDAQEIYRVLLQSVIAEKFNNRYNETVLHLKLAFCAFELGNSAVALYHAQRVCEIIPDESVKKRLKEKYKDANTLIAKIKRISE
ncbi:tetratricopeptide repeat protein [candidate division KSB1 bacterium]|nr:tetratricopeptide repeat protein [candidate division KSB1 bacterium]